jgi:hypothetical protein
MIIWTRLGFLGLLIPVLLSVAVKKIADAFWGLGHFSSNQTMGLAFIIGTPIVWFLGKKLNSKNPRELIDPKTNERVLIKEAHTIFWMPMEYFAVILCGLGVFWLLTPDLARL